MPKCCRKFGPAIRFAIVNWPVTKLTDMTVRGFKHAFATAVKPSARVVVFLIPNQGDLS